MSPIQILNGVIADTPTKLTDKVKVSVPDLQTMSRQVYGPLPFDPIVSGHGGTRLPQAGDSAIVGVDEGTGRQWVVGWHRDDPTLPPYSSEGGSGSDDDRSGLILAGSSGFDKAAWAALAPYVLEGNILVDVSTGVPRYAHAIWPDSSLGSFVALELSSDHTKINSYRVSYRPFAAPHGRLTWGTPGLFPISDAAASALVRRVPEVRSGHTARNNMVPSDEELAAVYAAAVSISGGWSIDTINPYILQVTGRPGITNPTTDELIQWGSQKWGIPTDALRAQAHLETVWNMDFLGDLHTVSPSDYLLHPIQARVPPSDVYQSLGIMQVQWTPDGSLGPGSNPLRYLSTAFNIDYCCAHVRFHLDNPDGQRAAWGDPSYVEHDYEVAQGGWFQPYPWRNSGQMNYVAGIASRLIDRPWLVAEFSDVLSGIVLLEQPTISRSFNGSPLVRPPIIEGPYHIPAPPGPPVNVVASAGDGTVTLNWNPPIDPGEAPIAYYRFTNVQYGWTLDTNYEAQRPYTMGGLTNGETISFMVRAITVFGTVGPQSVASNLVTPTAPPPASLPGAPTGLTGAPRNGAVTLTWVAPSDGGAAISAWRVTPYVGGVAQTPITTSAPQTSATISGLTNGQAYTFKVAAINSVGTGPDSSASAAITPVLPAVPIPANMPIISRGLPATSTQPPGQLANISAAAAVNAIRADQWRSINVPSSGTPQRLTLDMRSLSNAQLSSVWAVLHNQSAPGAVYPGTNNPSWYGMPKTFRLLAHASTGSEPAASDSGWTQIVTVSDPSTVCVIMTGAADAGLDLSAYNWLAVEVTATWQIAEDTIFNFDLRDVRNGHEDSFYFYGDSWIFEGVRNIRPDNPPWRDGAIEGLIEAATSRHWPIIQPAGTGGWRADIGNSNKAGYIGQTKCKIVVIAFGANDANAAGIDLNLSGGVSSTYAQQFKLDMQAMVDYAVGLGKYVIIPHVNYQTLVAWSFANSLILNQIIDQILDENDDTTIAGAGIFEFFQLHPQLLRIGGTGDVNLHPSFDIADTAHQYLGKTGYEWYHSVWADWIVANFYTAPGSTIPGTPTAVSGTHGDGTVDLTWTAPSSDGGATITSYRITPSIAGVVQSSIISIGAGTSFTVTGLTNGTAYTFQVAATNSVGTGSDSAASAPVTPASTAPTTLAFSDDFESGLGAWNSPEELGATFTAVASAPAHGGSNALRLTTNGSGVGLIRTVHTGWTEMDTLVKFWFRIHFATTGSVLEGRDDSGLHLWKLDYDGFNHRLDLEVYGDGNTFKTTISSANGSVPLDTWVYVEIRHFAAVAGFAHLTIDGGTPADYAGDISRATALRQLQAWAEAANSDQSYDDLQVYH